MNSCKIVHLTSVHPRYDTRIFLKECQTLAKYYTVSLIVADGKGDEIKQGIKIYDVGQPAGRVQRIFKTTRKMLKKALKLNADIYHLHDPELLLIASALKRAGKRVVFDAHEDLPKQILSKPYLKSWQTKLLSRLTAAYETYTCKKVSAIITATPFIRDKFLKINKNSVDINNYPILSELYDGKVDWSFKKRQICYIGGIAKIRGIIELVTALQYVKSAEQKILVVGGNFTESDTEAAVKKLPGFSWVQEKGFLKRAEVKTLLKESIAGVVNFLPVPNHTDAQPNKMFEYMAAGIPVIASDFPLWREIIEGNNCGVCVDPLKPKEIAQTIQYLLDNKVIAQKMGENGRRAVENKYNWDNEAHKLLSCYKQLCAN